MCIRDRAWGHPVDHTKGQEAVPTQSTNVDVGNDPIREVCNCLLYTSDAADERSSVDLGGRRIIKKKKNESRRSRTSDQQERHNKRRLQQSQ